MIAYNTNYRNPKINHKKASRREKLCRSRKLSFKGDDMVEKCNTEDLTAWCHKELNGAFHWYSLPFQIFYMDDLFTIGFQDETDRLAFALRWLKNYEVY